MGAASCSTAAVPDFPGDHQAAFAEATSIVDEDSKINIVDPCVISLGESAACSSLSNERTDPVKNCATEATARTGIGAAAAVLLPSDDNTPYHANAVEANSTEVPCSSSTSPAAGSDSTSGCDGGMAQVSLLARTSVVASASVVDQNQEPVPPVLALCRHLQAERKVAKAVAPALEKQFDTSDAADDSGIPEGVQTAFLKEMARGTEGHQYDEAGIARVAHELENMTDPRAFYTKGSDAVNSIEIVQPKKKTPKKQAGGQPKGVKKAAPKETKGDASGPKRKERLPGCAVKAELAKHMTQEELDDHEERRERWMKSEMRKIKQREDINRRMDTACHQQ